MKNFLHHFFQGRYGAYGMDRLTRVLLVIAALFLVISFATPLGFLYYIAFVILFYCYFRMFSKNIPARYKENEIFVKKTDRVASFFKNTGKKISEFRKYHIYKCPSCGQKIRIPRGKGKIAISCPRCKNEFVKRS